MDCLIAAVAIRENATLPHNDHDFEVLARDTRLRTEQYRVLRSVPVRYGPPTGQRRRRPCGRASGLRT